MTGRKPRKDLTNKKFGRWTVLKFDESESRSSWVCQCECGTVKSVLTGNLLRNKTRSCGCYRREVLKEVRTTHGMRSTKLYSTWSKMKDRCYNKNVPDYKNYGGRGIEVCDEWLDDFESFHKWAISNGYKESLEIDRVDVNGNYEPSNCRFVDRITNANNKRNNRLITHNGQTKTLSEWSRITGINRKTITSRIKYGWKEEYLLEKVVGSNDKRS